MFDIGEEEVAIMSFKRRLVQQFIDNFSKQLFLFMIQALHRNILTQHLKITH